MKTYPVLDVTTETTEQDIFHAVVEHLREQKMPCHAGFSVGKISACVNRNDAGNACAAACLFTDEEAAGPSWACLLEREKPKRLRRFDDLLRALQCAHNRSFCLSEINYQLSLIAKRWSFNFQPLTEWDVSGLN